MMRGRFPRRKFAKLKSAYREGGKRSVCSSLFDLRKAAK
jgi:hypothetical protein